MFKKNHFSYLKEAQLLINLLPFYIIIEGISKGYWVLSLESWIFVISLIGEFVILWFIIVRKGSINPYLTLISGSMCLIGLYLQFWFYWASAIYFLSIAISFLNLTSTKNPFLMDDKDQKRVFLKRFLYVEVIGLNGIVISLILSAFFWDYTLIYAGIGAEITLLILNFSKMSDSEANTDLEKAMESNQDLKIKNTEYIKSFILILTSVGIAGGCGVVSLLVLHGFIVFVPVDSSTGKILCGIIVGFISAIFALIHRNIE